MMRLADLLAGIPGAKVVGDPTVAIAEVRDDSRKVQPGDLFVAVAGTKQDGHRFIEEAIARGAVAVVTEPPAPEAPTFVLVENARQALARLASNRFPAAMTLAAVTGTSGKTTTTYLLESMLAAAGRRPGVVGTVNYRYAGRVQDAPLTTPGALALHALFAEMKAAGCTDAVLETSSHALDQGRLHGCRFGVAALTNVTQDHLDYHGTLERYFEAKAILFRELLDGVAVLHVDRDDGRKMRSVVRGNVLGVATTAGVAADVTVTGCVLDGGQTRATLVTPIGPIEITSSLVGAYNLANIALAAGMAIGLGLPGPAIAAGVASLPGVPGRLERVANRRGVLCLVDYAHKPDALEQALAVVRPLTQKRLIVVFGCGGDRDRTKRAIMGEAAGRRADLVIVTSDNPRTEDPRSIIDMILPGVERSGAKSYLVEVDRRAAIQKAIAVAEPGDTVLIAGKGHEDYQIVGAINSHFDDR